MTTTSAPTLTPAVRLEHLIVPYLGLILAVLAVYGNVYDNAFLFDDELIITKNELLDGWNNFGKLFVSSTTEGTHIAGGFYRPLQLILYFFVNHIAGRSTFAFHLVNIVLHAANACLIYALGKKLKFSPPAVFFATLIWAVHPVHTEAVTYMSGTADLLFVFFALLACVIIVPDGSFRRVMLALPIFALGLISKETSVIIPGLVIVCLFAANPDRLNWKLYRHTWPLWIIAAIYMIWRLGNDQFDGPRRYEHLYVLKDFSNISLYASHFWYRFYTFLATLPAYAGLLVWPVGLHMERTFTIFNDFPEPPELLGLVFVIGAAIQIFRTVFRKKDDRPNMALSWGLLWCGVAHFPESGLVAPSNSLFLEHWLYVPSIGLFLGGAENVYSALQKTNWKQWKPVTACACVALAAGLGVMTLRQNTVWHDPISFYTHMFKYGAVSARAHNNLALAYAENNRLPEALDEFRKAISLTDTYAETRHNYALTLLRQPDAPEHAQEAIENLNRALEIDPNFYRSMEALASIYDHLGDHEKSAEYTRRAEIIKSRFNGQ